MRLTSYSDYSLRVLMYLAVRADAVATIESADNAVRPFKKMDLVECFDPDTSQCRIEPACRLRGVLGEALDAFLTTLDRYTLADLVARRRKPLSDLLAVAR